jgi:hypothetical protein
MLNLAILEDPPHQAVIGIANGHPGKDIHNLVGIESREVTTLSYTTFPFGALKVSPG